MGSSCCEKVVVLIVLNLCLVISIINAVSQWDPFCIPETLYTPYVRVFQKGRDGVLLRDRGPGFIDVNGLKDIYVCTNGLVMLYYAKTNKERNEVYEHGELHWAPHHCELYNPTCTTMGIDQPRKTLLSILLIGHPTDYRRPALQMFIAPMYDSLYKGYINITSLLMIGTEGECLIEKGVERARLRVRIVPPSPPAPAPGASPAPSEDKPPMFCQLDAQRKLGQKGIITLNKPAAAPSAAPPENPFDFVNSTYLLPPNENLKIETGSRIIPRFSASKSEYASKYVEATLIPVADEVYTALLNDRKMRFVGCLRYPDFSAEQLRIITARYNDLHVGKDPASPAPVDITKEKEYVPDATDPEFWKTTVQSPFPVDPSSPAGPGKTRFDEYIEGGWAIQKHDDAIKPVNDAVTDLDKAKAGPGGGAAPVQLDIDKAEAALKSAKMKYSLWPLKQAYVQLKEHTKIIEDDVKKAWDDIYKTDLTQPVASPAPPLPTVDFSKSPIVLDDATYTLDVTARMYIATQQTLSQKKYDRRFEPYNPVLVKEYEDQTKLLAALSERLRMKSLELGPKISKAETLYARYKLYKSLMKKALAELETAITSLEKAHEPVVVPNAGSLMTKYFADTLIEIADELKAGATTPDYTDGGRACFPLSSLKVACSGIKPKSDRTCKLLKNRVGKGATFLDTDIWRDKVFNLMESVFKKACPYISDEFPIAINRIVKGYLLSDPQGTGLTYPINGSRLYSADHLYQDKVYNLTYSMMNQSMQADKTTVNTNGTLRGRDPFWDMIETALEDCSARITPMEFWHNEEGDRPMYITLRKHFANNGTDAHFDVEDLYMQEKADLEYSFNWAVDINWRIFATVLGVCMPQYENKIPLISARFYALYTQDFLYPLRQIWMSNRDNPILKVILGSYYGTGKGDRWSRICMESSFVESGDPTYRPPRGLYVNAFTEMNYFTSGPMAGTSGKLAAML